MNLKGFTLSLFTIALGVAHASGCTSGRSPQCPPFEAASEHANGGARSADESETAEYYAPPYTESVDWLVAKEIIEAGPKQIQRINVLEGDNARHVQALYSREIDE